MAKEKAASSSDALLDVVRQELVAVVDAIKELAQQQAQVNAQILARLDRAAPTELPPPTEPVTTLPAADAAPARVSSWQDDPFSETMPSANPPDAAVETIPLVPNTNPRLQTRIAEPRPNPGVFQPGASEFRYWQAEEALARGVNFWAAALPAGTKWTTFVPTLAVTLVAPVDDLNAQYRRDLGLRFFHHTVAGRTIYTADSPDVILHELGHAVLDAVRPQLFDAASLEASAFHESFGDMSAILCGLQLPGVRRTLLRETGGRLNVNSRLSRVAEQLGWGLRQQSPMSVDRDCLRNAVNPFFYHDPRTLPPRAPATQLSSEEHSFSRVFTGAFLDGLNGMLAALGPTDENLSRVSRDMARLLIAGVRAARVLPNYFNQVAAAMLAADRTVTQGRYGAALAGGFIRHGVMSPAEGRAGGGAAPAWSSAPVPPDGVGMAGGDDGHLSGAEDAPTLPARLVSAPGLEFSVFVHADSRRVGGGIAAASESGADDDAAEYVENLIRRGKIRIPATSGTAAANPPPATVSRPSRQTHTLERRDGGQWQLKRLLFDCGCGS